MNQSTLPVSHATQAPQNDETLRYGITLFLLASTAP